MSAKRVKLIAETLWNTLHPDEGPLFKRPTGEITQYIKLGRAVYNALREDVLREAQFRKETPTKVVEPPPALNFFFGHNHLPEPIDPPSLEEVVELKGRIKDMLAQDEDS